MLFTISIFVSNMSQLLAFGPVKHSSVQDIKVFSFLTFNYTEDERLKECCLRAIYRDEIVIELNKIRLD